MGSVSSIAASAALSASQLSALTAVDVGFTTTVGGKTYSADVTYSGGQYVAQDALVSGAEATGGNMQTAEDNLINRIDALV